MFWFTAITSALLVLFTWVGFRLYERYRSYQLFRNLGIPGPPPHFITGNTTSVRMGSKMPLDNLQKWGAIYGKMFGYFRSGLPVLVVSDLDLLKQILIKDFHMFPNRGRGRVSIKIILDSLIGLRGERWKEVRKTLNPSFTTSKIKQLSHIVNRKISTFEEVIDEMATTEGGQSDDGFDIYEQFRRLTLDVIGECALTVKIDCQRDVDNTIFRSLQGAIRGGHSQLAFILGFIPGMDTIMQWYVMNTALFKIAKSINRYLYSVIRSRKSRQVNNTINMLQLMLNTATANPVNCVTNSDSREEGSDNAPGPSSRTRSIEPLTNDEIVGNCWAFLIAGYETTSTALAYIAHMLVVHPDVQQKVYEEIINRTKVCETLPLSR